MKQKQWPNPLPIEFVIAPAIFLFAYWQGSAKNNDTAYRQT
jgi:hypothetical protein